MTIVGVSITKVNAEKNINSTADKVGINNNISIKEVTDKDFSLGASKQKGLRFNFTFKCSYTPDIGTIDLEGDVLYLTKTEDAARIIGEWKDKKKISAEIMEPILNSALNKAQLQAIKISQDLNLPSPVMLPRVERGKEKGKDNAKEEKKN